jgi:hypothetical protein
MHDHIDGHIKLINAIVALAVLDTTRQCKHKLDTTRQCKHKLDTEAQTAFRFLFSDDVDVYLELIDINPDHFKRKLKESMYNNSTAFTDTQKRAFKMNFVKWENYSKVARLSLATTE